MVDTDYNSDQKLLTNGNTFIRTAAAVLWNRN